MRERPKLTYEFMLGVQAAEIFSLRAELEATRGDLEDALAALETGPDRAEPA